MSNDDKLSRLAFTIQFEGLILQVDNKATHEGKLAVAIQIDPGLASANGKVYLTVGSFLEMAKEVERIYKEYYLESEDNTNGED